MRYSILLLMVGLPQSGKSTQARKLADENNWPIVSPDAIRLALHGHPYIHDAEDYVWAVAKTMAKALFLAGHETVILDATNVTRKRRDNWKDKMWRREFMVMITSPEKCRERVETQGRYDLVPVIERMESAFEAVASDETETDDPIEYRSGE